MYLLNRTRGCYRNIINLYGKCNRSYTLIFDFKPIVTIIAEMFGIVLIIFIPFANRIGKRDIVEELNKDNK